MYTKSKEIALKEQINSVHLFEYIERKRRRVRRSYLTVG